MNNLVIIGASAMGRETCVYAYDCGMVVKGFLDSRESILDGYDEYPPILGSAEDYIPNKNDVFVCAVGEPNEKKKYVENMLSKGGCFVSVIHPSAYIGKNVAIEYGCVVAPGSIITTDVRLGKHVIVNANSSISHDCIVDDFVTISPGCHIAGWCHLGSGVFLGIHSALIPHVNIGDNVLVAAGAVVTKSFSSGRLMGIPAISK